MSNTKWQTIEVPTHPLEGACWVRCVAHLRQNATGEVRRYETDAILEDGEEVPSVFNWKENNYSCDCNRALFFGYAVGLKYEDMPERRCTHGQFSANLENPVTGEIFYREFE